MQHALRGINHNQAFDAASATSDMARHHVACCAQTDCHGEQAAYILESVEQAAAYLILGTRPGCTHVSVCGHVPAVGRVVAAGWLRGPDGGLSGH